MTVVRGQVVLFFSDTVMKLEDVYAVGVPNFDFVSDVIIVVHLGRLGASPETPPD
jgi:hypothetical protein